MVWVEQRFLVDVEESLLDLPLPFDVGHGEQNRL